MSGQRWFDPELDELLGHDPALLEMARNARTQVPEPQLDPRFATQLRAQLLREARTILASPTEKRGRRVSPLRPRLSWTGPAAGLALAAAIVLALTNSPLHDQTHYTWGSPLARDLSVDTNAAITVSFAQPMDEPAVASGIHIQPATSFSTKWQGNTLVIVPTHPLVDNTPYVVTIDRTAARAASGALPPANITVSFATAPQPVAGMPLAWQGAGPVDAKANLAPGTGATVLAWPVTPAPAVAASPSPTASPTPAPSAAPSASASASPAAGATPELVAYGSDGTTTTLAPAGTAAAWSPDGRQLLLAEPTASGGSNLCIATPTDPGSTPTVVATDVLPVQAVAWGRDGSLVWMDAAAITVRHNDGRSAVAVSIPTGAAAYLASDGEHALVGDLLTEIDSGSTRDLGTVKLAAFSSDGSKLAWTGGDEQTISITGTSSGSATLSIPQPAPISGKISSLALNRDGTRLAYVTSSQTVVIDSGSGAYLASGAARSNPVFTDDGNWLFAIDKGSGQVVVSSLPGNRGFSDNGFALNAVQAFVHAQVSGDTQTMQDYAAAGVTLPDASAHYSRADIVSLFSSGSTAEANVRLIVDPDAQHPAGEAADEVLQLQADAGGHYLVNGAGLGSLGDLPPGPHLVRLTRYWTDSKLELNLTFDGELQPGTVDGAFTLAPTGGGDIGKVTATYDPASHSVTLTAPRSDKELQLNIASSLLDVAGNPLHDPYTATLPAL